MPYIAIKSYPKEEETKKLLVEKINDVVMEVVGCPAQAITISLEEIAPEDWEAKVKIPEIEANLDKMMILSGERK